MTYDNSTLVDSTPRYVRATTLIVLFLSTATKHWGSGAARMRSAWAIAVAHPRTSHSRLCHHPQPPTQAPIQYPATWLPVRRDARMMRKAGMSAKPFGCVVAPPQAQKHTWFPMASSGDDDCLVPRGSGYISRKYLRYMLAKPQLTLKLSLSASPRTREGPSGATSLPHRTGRAGGHPMHSSQMAERPPP